VKAPVFPGNGDERSVNMDDPLHHNPIMGFSDKLDAFSKNREGGVFLTGILVSVVSGPR